MTEQTIIGDKGHADDIAATLPDARRVPHHEALVSYRGQIWIGVNDPQTRARIAQELGINDQPWVHPDAWVSPESTYGPGTHINYGAIMTRTTIGKHCTIAPGVIICGDVIIRDRVLIGAGAIIGNLVTIGSDTIIGMGAVVLPNQSLWGGTWVGNPAKQIE